MAKQKKTADNGKILYQFDSLYDDKTFNDTAEMVLTALPRIGYPALSIIVIVYGIILVITSFFNGGTNFWYGVVAASLGVILLIVRWRMPVQSAHASSAKLLESCGTTSVIMHMIFRSSELEVKDTVNNSSISVKYKTASRLIRGKGYIVICTRKNQTVILHEDQLPEGFVSFLLEKCSGAGTKGFRSKRSKDKKQENK